MIGRISIKLLYHHSWADKKEQAHIPLFVSVFMMIKGNKRISRSREDTDDE